MIIGAQLYTVREFCRELSAFSETLKRIADIGYTTVQVSGTCDYSPEWLKEQLDVNGLRCVLTHVNPQRLINETDDICNGHKLFDCPRIGLGSSGVKNLNDESYSDFVSKFKPVARKISQNGLKFFFHNHVSEFFKSGLGTTYMERLTEDFSSEELQFTLDTYWAQYAGGDPIRWMRKLAGRLECIHLKDMTFDPDWTHRMAPVGHGTMDFQGIVEAAPDCGVEYLLVEQDNCYGEDPFVCLKKSYDYLKSLGLN